MESSTLQNAADFGIWFDARRLWAEDFDPDKPTKFPVEVTWKEEYLGGKRIVDYSCREACCGHPRTRQITVRAKCDDRCIVTVGGKETTGYVPRELNIGGGDYVFFAYCADCGQITSGEFPL